MIAKDNTVIQAVKDFEKILDSYVNFGSQDSEPQWEYRKLLKQVFKGVNTIVIPKTARGWQLYSGMEGAEQAALVIGNTFDALREVIYKSEYSEAIFAAHYFGVFDE